MNRLLYLLFVSVFLFDFLHESIPAVPKLVTWVPDLLAVYCAALISLKIVVSKKHWIQRGYLCFLSLYISITIVSIIANESTLSSVFIGIRIYFRYIPFFFLPFVYDLSEKDFFKQLRLLFLLLVMQLPVAIGQKLYFGYLAHHHQTGDAVCGTVLSSGVLSILLICSIAVLLAFHLKNYINFRYLVAAAFLMFLPTTINETKVTFFLLPFAFSIPIFIHKEHSINEKYRKVFKIIMVCFACVVVFVPIYNSIKPDKAPEILDFLKNTDKLQSYLYRGGDDVNNSLSLRRFDTIVFAYKDISKDWLRFLFGYGIGNVTSSSFWGLSSSVYAERSKYKPESLGITRLFWEVGVVGIILYLIFLILVYRSARSLCRSWSIFGAFALGWVAVVPIVGVCLFYLDMIKNGVLSLCFWYFSGVVGSTAFRFQSVLEQKRLGAEFGCYPGRMPLVHSEQVSVKIL